MIPFTKTRSPSSPNTSKAAPFGFPTPKTSSIPTPQPTVATNKILVAKKNLHKGYLYGAVSNGGAEIDLGNGYGLQIIATGDSFCVAQLYHYAMDAAVEKQSWQKSKTVVVNGKQNDKKEPTKVQEKIVAEIKQEAAW